MGRYYWSKRTLKSDCKSLTIKFLQEHGYLKSGSLWGNVQWSRNGEPTGNINIRTMIDSYLSIRFWYTRTDSTTEEKRDLDYDLRLISQTCNYGGRRWYFECWHCKRKCTAVYLDQSDIFLCRRCNNLAYESQNVNRRSKWYPMGKILDFETRESLPQARDKYSWYKGRPTKNFLKYMHSINELLRAEKYLN